MAARSALETERRTATALDDAALADLARYFRGELIRPGDPQYDVARRIWNGAIDRHPAFVARGTGVADVQAVWFARERDLLGRAWARVAPGRHCCPITVHWLLSHPHNS